MPRTTKWLCNLALACACLPAAALADDDLADALRGCASITDVADRMNCYDSLAAAQATPPHSAPADPVPPNAVPLPPKTAPATEAYANGAAAPDTMVPAIDNEVGREQLRGDDGVEPPKYTAKVVECKRNSVGRLFFVLENGQIWKQSDHARFRRRDCEFDVTLTRDALGYKLKINGTKSNYRVARVQ